MATKATAAHQSSDSDNTCLKLPKPRLRGSTSLEACMQRRRSTRMFSRAMLEVEDLSQFLWAAQGITRMGGLRTTPSAGALYPIRLYVLASAVRGVTPGLYRYDVDYHQIEMVLAGRHRSRLAECKLDHAAEQAPALIIMAADYRSPKREFEDKAPRLVHIEAGHIGQNICLEAVALGLGSIGLGAFEMEDVRQLLGLPETQEPIYAVAVGRIEV